MSNQVLFAVCVIISVLLFVIAAAFDAFPQKDRLLYVGLAFLAASIYFK